MAKIFQNGLSVLEKKKKKCHHEDGHRLPECEKQMRHEEVEKV